MFVLALDTSTPACAVAVVEIDVATGRTRPVAASSVVDPRRHGEVLAPAVRAVLGEAGLAADGLAAVVAGNGPGPYTSLRIGVVTAVALGQALGVPAVGVCSLDGVPPPAGVPTSWAAVTDARRREVFWAVYDHDGARTHGPAVAAPAAVADELRARSVTVVAGPGAAAYPAAFGGFTATGAQSFPDPARLVDRVGPDLLAGRASDPLVPVYLRRPDAAEPRPVGSAAR